jgi:uroporphyrinogen-III synthase
VGRLFIHKAKYNDRVSEAESWRDVPFYVVGPSTALPLTALSSSYPDSPHTPTASNIRGENTGTSEELSKFIVKDLADRDKGKERNLKLLYFTGDKNRDTLPKIIEEASIGLYSIQVYATQGARDFPERLRSVLEDRFRGKSA